MGKFATCQNNLAAICAADSFFTDNTDPMNPVIKVPIVSLQDGDWQTKLDATLAEIGVGLVVVFFSAKLTDIQDDFSLAFNLQFKLVCVYNPTVADDGSVTAFDIAERAIILLHGTPNGVSPGDATLPSRFRVDPSSLFPMPMTPQTALIDKKNLLINTTIDLSAA